MSALRIIVAAAIGIPIAAAYVVAYVRLRAKPRVPPERMSVQGRKRIGRLKVSRFVLLIAWSVSVLAVFDGNVSAGAAAAWSAVYFATMTGMAACQIGIYALERGSAW